MWTTRLTPAQADQVLALAERATAADGTAPLNEAAHLALRDDSAEHLWALEGTDVVGYLQWEQGYRTAQLVVDPAHRRRGHGRWLLGRLANALRDARSSLAGSSGTEGGISSSLAGSSETEGGINSSLAGSSGTEATQWGVWAFGDLPPARGLAASLGLSASRGLLVMERPLDTPVTSPPADGLRLRGFRPGDEAAFLAVNAAAFASHPEQGALDDAGLAARMAEPWFDPTGLILGFDQDGLAGFHWTKLVDGVGEVYVIGVAPRAQGRGYGRVLLQSGLAFLAARGAARVRLYVDMAEPVAVRMYESAGFHVAYRDVLYAPEHGSVQKQERS
jgi:mycothiol synthase